MGFITCPSCHEINSDNRLICANCGNMLAADAQPKPAPRPKKKTIFQNRRAVYLTLSLIGSLVLGLIVYGLTHDVGYFCSSPYYWLGVVTAVLWIRKINASEWKFHPKELWALRVVFTGLSLVAAPLFIILVQLPLGGFLAKAGDQPAVVAPKIARPAGPRKPIFTRAGVLKTAKYTGFSILLFVVIVGLTILVAPVFIRWSDGISSDLAQKAQVEQAATAQAKADHTAARQSARENQVAGLVKTWGSTVNQCNPTKIPAYFSDGGNGMLSYRIPSGPKPAHLLLVNWSSDIEQDVSLSSEQANLPAESRASSAADLTWVVCLNQYDKMFDSCAYYQNENAKSFSFSLKRMSNHIDVAMFDPASNDYFAHFVVTGTAPGECATAPVPKNDADYYLYGGKANFQQVRDVLVTHFMGK